MHALFDAAARGGSGGRDRAGRSVGAGGRAVRAPEPDRGGALLGGARAAAPAHPLHHVGVARLGPYRVGS